MCEIHYRSLKKGALGGFQLEIELSEMLQCYPKTLQVFFFCAAKYYNFIQVNDAVGQIQLSQRILHKMLECHRCMLHNPKGILVNS